MKKLITALLIICLAACTIDDVKPNRFTEGAPNVQKFLLPIEMAAPKEITLPYEGDGIKLELLTDFDNQFINTPLSFWDNKRIFSGYNGIYKSIDGGVHWDLKFESPGSVLDIRFLKQKRFTGYAVGFTTYSMRRPVNYMPNSWIAKTTDGGETWKLVYKNPSIAIHSIYPVASSPGCIIAVGYGIILRSNDSGKTWNIVFEGSSALGTFVPLTDKHLIVVGYPTGIISTDYGINWTPISTESLSIGECTLAEYESNGNVSGVEYSIGSLNNNSWGTTVFKTVFYADDMTIADRQPVYTTKEFQFRALAVSANGKPIFTGVDYNYQTYTPGNRTLLVFPTDSKWIPLILKAENISSEFPQYVAGIEDAFCVDNECYFRVAICFGGCAVGGNPCSYELLKLTFIKN